MTKRHWRPTRISALVFAAGSRHKGISGAYRTLPTGGLIGDMAWQRRNARDLPDPETLDPEGDYTGRELEEYADALLRQDARTHNPINGENPILFEEHLYNRRRREILVASGTPDELQGLEDKPGVTRGDGQRIFNRTHPQGRKVNSEDQRRRNGASYYR